MANILNEFTKGLGRGLGYQAARNITSFPSSRNVSNSRETKLNSWFWIGCFLLIPYLPIYLLIYGIIRYHKRSFTFKVLRDGRREIPDRRYRCGYRVESYSYIQKEKVLATTEERKIFKSQGRAMIAASVIMLILFVLII